MGTWGRKFAGLLGIVLLALTLLVMVAGPSLAALKDVGPVDVTNGFPVWYRDNSTNHAITIPPNPEQTFPQGLPLEICLAQTESPTGGGATMCNLLAEGTFIPTDPIVFPSNFPGEAFWFAAESAFTGTGDIGDALLVIGLEAAFATGDPVPGDQVSFARVRIRVDVNTAGTYRITHPYGVQTFEVDTPDVRAINATSDIGIAEGGVFTGALNGAIGPFLTWDTDFPVVVGDEAYIGDPNVPHTVTGSPFDTNFFRVERIDAQGNVLSSQQSELFSLTGKIFTTPIASPLSVTRASYARNAAFAQIDVFAQADIVSNSPPSLSALEVSGANIPTTALATDGAGNFFAHIDGLVPSQIPATVTVTNIGDVPPTTVEVQVVDEVTISAAEYNPLNATLHLEASSSDQLVVPTLITDFGPLTNGILDVAGLEAPRATITVSSSAGGLDTEPIIVPLIPEPASGVVVTAAPASPQNPGPVVTFSAVGEGGSGTFEYRFWLKDPVTGWAVVQPYSTTASWDWNTAGVNTGNYFVQVDVRSIGSPANRDAAGVVAYALAPVAATDVTLAVDPASPQTVGTPVTFTAAGVGGSGSYEYRFWLKTGAAWAVVQPYSTTATWQWNTSAAAAGNYFIQVDVRSAGSPAAREAARVAGYSLN